MSVWSERQAEYILDSTATLNLACGAVRSGKSTCSLGRWLVHVQQGPPDDLFMIGITIGSLLRNCVLPMQSWLGRSRCHIKRSVGEVRLGDAERGRLIYLLGAGDIRSADRLSGATAAGIYGDEMNKWPEELFRTCLERVSVDGAAIYGTLNPESPFHYLYTDFVQRAAEVDLKLVNFLLDDNPGLREAYKARLRKQHTGVWHQRRILGRWVAAEGAVYDLWGDGKAFEVDALPDPAAVLLRWVGGIDHGTSAPFSAVRLAVTESRERSYYVEREYYWASGQEGQQLSDEQYCTRLEREWGEETVKGMTWYVDPEAAHFIAAARARGWRCAKANNDVREGIACLSSLQALGRLKVLRGRCPELSKSLGSYVWDAKAAKKGVEKPLKQGDHPADALRYPVYSIEGPGRGVATVGPPLQVLRLRGI